MSPVPEKPHVTQPQSRCRFGIATGDMTPPVGIYHRMWGAARHDRATGVHRPLRATVVAMRSLDDTRRDRPDLPRDQLLVALDHCILGTEELERLLAAMERRTDVGREDVAVVCSHTHAAGLLSLDRADLPGGELIPPYLDALAETVAQLADDARSSAAPATIVYGMGRCALARNRDYWDAVGGRYVCGVNPNAPADDTLTVARVEGGDGSLIATIVNYACHATTLAAENTLISPDFPGAMRETVEKATGAPCLFLQGASGDLGPRDGYTDDTNVADRNGRQLGHAALGALADLDPGLTRFVYEGPLESGAALGIWRHEPLSADTVQGLARWRSWRGAIELPYRADLVPTAALAMDLARLEAAEARARDDRDAEAAQHNRTLTERRRRELTRRRALPAGTHFPWQAAVWVMGRAVWVCVQGEPYSALQVELRRRFPDACVIVASLGFAWSVGYLPTAHSYGKDLYQQNIAVVAPGALEQAIDTLVERIAMLLDTDETPTSNP